MRRAVEESEQEMTWQFYRGYSDRKSAVARTEARLLARLEIAAVYCGRKGSQGQQGGQCEHVHNSKKKQVLWSEPLMSLNNTSF